MVAVSGSSELMLVMGYGAEGRGKQDMYICPVNPFTLSINDYPRIGGGNCSDKIIMMMIIVIIIALKGAN